MIRGSRARTRIRESAATVVRQLQRFLRDGLRCGIAFHEGGTIRPPLRLAAAQMKQNARLVAAVRALFRVSGACGGPEGRSGGLPNAQPGMDNPGQAGRGLPFVRGRGRAVGGAGEAAVGVVQLAQRVLKGRELRAGGAGGLGKSLRVSSNK